jgi:hypothetical protein
MHLAFAKRPSTLVKPLALAAAGLHDNAREAEAA